MREIDAHANLNRWRDRPVENATLAAGLLVAAMALPTPWTALGTAVVVAASLRSAGIPHRAFLRAVRVPAGFLAAGCLPLCVAISFDRGTPLLTWAPGGAEVALRTGLRSATALSATLLLAFTTPFPRLASLLRAVRVPAVLVDLLGLVYRSIFVLDESLRSARLALAARNGFRHRSAAARSVPLLASSAFLRSLDRAGRLETALRCRGGSDSAWTTEPPTRPRALRMAFSVAAPLGVVAVSLLLGGFLVR